MKTEKAKAAFLDAKQELSPRTIKWYGEALAYLEQECPKLPKKPEPLRSALGRVKSVWVRDGYWRVWRAFFRWCSSEFGTAYPMGRVERPRVPKVEIRALELGELGVVLDSAGSVRDRAIIALALDSGVRASEFGRLRAQDVGKETVMLWGKGKKQALVPISPETHHLLELLGRGEHHQGYLFLGQRGRLTRSGVYYVVRRCMERAGISSPKRGAHCLRHSLGKNYIAAGGDAFSLMRIMRHSDIATTQKYVHLAMVDVLEQHRRHSPLSSLYKGELKGLRPFKGEGDKGAEVDKQPLPLTKGK